VTIAREMLSAAPYDHALDIDHLATALEGCLECAQTCTACAAADVAERDVEQMRRCALLCAQCADICTATGRFLSRDLSEQDAALQHLLQACVRACTDCAAECERHAAHHRHCALCGEACRRCAEACTQLLRDDVGETMRALQGG
jgi:hypothetical protein